MANFNENFEENMIKAVPAAAKEIESKMHSDLVNLANGRVFNDMRDQKTVNNSTPNSNMNAPAQEQNAKTLVREKNNAPRVINNPEPVQQVNPTVSDQYRNVPSEENPFDSLRESGNANASTIIIVIASFVIVAMLIIICLTILNAFGMLPY